MSTDSSAVIDDLQMYRPIEIARILRVSSVTIGRAVRDGRLKAIRVGGQWRILGADVQAYIEIGTQRALRRY